MGNVRDCYMLMAISADNGIDHRFFQSKDVALEDFQRATKPGVDAAVYHYDTDGRCTVIARVLHEHP